MTIRCAVIGLGMGRGHAKAYSEHKDCQLVAVADIDAARRERAAKEWNCATYTTAEELLEKAKADVVSIATPNALHRPLTLAALASGAHVLCEKPIAMTAAEGREMVAAAKTAGRRLMINLSYRFSPQSQVLKNLVDGGALGKVYAGRTVWLRRRGIPGLGGWFTDKKLSGGGPLIDLGVHRLDLALWLMGHPKSTWVMAGAWNHLGSRIGASQGKSYSVEDLAMAMIRFEDGSMLEVEAGWAANIKEGELMETRLLGTEGGLVQKNVGEGYDFQAEVFQERNGTQLDLSPHGPFPECKSAYHHFVEAIRDGKPHTATGEDGVAVQELLDAIYLSAAEGRPVAMGATTTKTGAGTG
ncbi:MAG: Gfo/Idh/MocA family oxidoreductase [Planctomycetes bacterium]|nr:Gfo/Idh/MocA family oxidoreductase [Planctomycetota bacterium]